MMTVPWMRDSSAMRGYTGLTFFIFVGALTSPPMRVGITDSGDRAGGGGGEERPPLPNTEATSLTPSMTPIWPAIDSYCGFSGVMASGATSGAACVLTSTGGLLAWTAWRGGAGGGGGSVMSPRTNAAINVVAGRGMAAGAINGSTINIATTTTCVAIDNGTT